MKEETKKLNNIKKAQIVKMVQENPPEKFFK